MNVYKLSKEGKKGKAASDCEETFEAVEEPRGSAELSARAAGTSAHSRHRNLGECASLCVRLSIAPRVVCAYKRAFFIRTRHPRLNLTRLPAAAVAAGG